MIFTPETKQELKIAIKEYYANREGGIKKYGIMNHWNVSKITDMSGLFINYYNFDEDISNWDVSNVINMRGMFQFCYKFNQSLNNWDVSNVISMENMFKFCELFNQPLNNWDVSNVTNMSYMFSYCIFNKPLNNWDVSNVINMRGMFHFCYKFNQSLNNWNLSNVIDMNYMFYNCNISEENKPVIPEKNIGVVKLYKELTSIQKEEHTECPISTDEYKEDTKVVITKCKYIFEYYGLKLWTDSSNNNTCPYCRSTL